MLKRKSSNSSKQCTIQSKAKLPVRSYSKKSIEALNNDTKNNQVNYAKRPLTGVLPPSGWKYSNKVEIVKEEQKRDVGKRNLSKDGNKSSRIPLSEELSNKKSEVTTYSKGIGRPPISSHCNRQVNNKARNLPKRISSMSKM